MRRDPYIFKKNIRIMKNNTYTSLRTLSEEDKWCIPIIKREKGPYLYDVDDNRFVDFFMGNCSLLLGHSEPVITSCIKGWLARGYAQGYPGPAQTLLSHRMSETLGGADHGGQQFVLAAGEADDDGFGAGLGDGLVDVLR